MPTRDEFLVCLRKLLDEATRLGFSEVTLTAGNLHRAVGGYPGTDHRMPTCCEAMRQLFVHSTDEELPNNLKKNGASFAIRYKLPR